MHEALILLPENVLSAKWNPGGCPDIGVGVVSGRPRSCRRHADGDAFLPDTCQRADALFDNSDSSRRTQRFERMAAATVERYRRPIVGTTALDRSWRSGGTADIEGPGRRGGAMSHSAGPAGWNRNAPLMRCRVPNKSVHVTRPADNRGRGRRDDCAVGSCGFRLARGGGVGAREQPDPGCGVADDRCAVAISPLPLTAVWDGALWVSSCCRPEPPSRPESANNGAVRRVRWR